MSSSSLYGYTGNVTVSSNNLTTLYNAQPGNVVVANVADRNFTTLYTNQSTISPTKPYGNSNVEAFLNSGTDGANTVQNIHMSESLYVGGQSYLGNVGNVHITGGQLNYVLATDGTGNLEWVEQTGYATNIVPYIHFDVTSTGNNQQFTDTLIESYAGNTDMNVMKNGVNIEPTFYEKVSNNTIQVNIPLNTGDTIDILATGAGSGEPAGNIYEIQYNGAGSFAANSSFTFYQPTSTLNVGNISTGNIAFDDVLGNSGNIANLDTVNSNISNLNVLTSALLGDIANVSILGGANGQYLTTDGSGVLNWTTGTSGGTATALNATIGNVIISGGSNNQVLTTYGNGTVHWTTVTSGSNAVGGSNAIQFANGANLNGSNQFTYTFETSTFSNTPHLHLISNTDPNTGYPDFSVITFDKDGTQGAGYGSINAGYLDTTTQISERHYSNGGFSFEGVNATVTPVTFYVAGEIAFNAGWSSYFAPANVKLGNVSYLKISGGTNGQVLKTDGSNNLSWTSTVSSASTAGTVTTAAQPNITSLGTLTGLTSNGVVNFSNTSNVTLGNVANLHISGGSSGYVLSTDGSGSLSWVAQSGGGNSYIVNGTSNVSIPTLNGNVTVGVNGVADILTISNTAVVITGTTTIQQGAEKVTANATGSTGTVDFDLLTQAILNKTGNATATFDINLRGNSTVTLDTVLSTNQSMTCTYVNKKNTGTPYALGNLKIDTVTQTVYWSNGNNPTTNAYPYDIYTFNILKTGSGTYTVFGTFGSYS